MKYNTILDNITNQELWDVFEFLPGEAKEVREHIIDMDNNKPWGLGHFIKKYDWGKIEAKAGGKINCGSYGCVYLSSTYKGESVALKVSKDNNILGAFLECIVSMILYKNRNHKLKIPKVYGMGMTTLEGKSHISIVMEKIHGETLSSLSSYRMKYSMDLLFEGLEIYQNSFNFSHRDLHSGNVMVGNDNVPYLIDFGNSCISIPKTKGSVRDTKSTAEVYAIAKGCLNRSHDVCMLVISLYNAGNGDFYQLAKNMCDDYRSRRSLTDLDGKPYADPVFHFWYVYGLYDIQLKYTPHFMFWKPSRFATMVGLKF